MMMMMMMMMLQRCCCSKDDERRKRRESVMENGHSCNVVVCFQDLMCLEHNNVACTSVTAAAATTARWVLVNWGFPATVAAVCELGLRSSFGDWWLLLLLLLMPDGEKSSAIREVVGATHTHTHRQTHLPRLTAGDQWRIDHWHNLAKKKVVVGILPVARMCSACTAAFAICSLLRASAAARRSSALL
jgi:hypothetical protein